MEPYNNDPAKRRRLDSNDIPAANQAGSAPHAGPPPTGDGLPIEDQPTRAMPIPGAAPQRDSAEDGRSPWARPAAPSPTAPPPPASQASPYIPARPRPAED